MQVRKQFPFAVFRARVAAISGLEHSTFRAANPGEPGSEKPKFYALDMFPVSQRRRPARRPSGGLHGHRHHSPATSACAASTSFIPWAGTPSACRRNNTPCRPAPIRARPPRRTSPTFRRQIEAIGFSYDWSREVNTTDPAYYKWTQWIFLQLYKKGLAYTSHAPVWYCPDLGTVLANEEVLQTDAGPAFRARQPSRRAPSAAPVDAQHHRLRRPAAGRSRRRSTGRTRSRKCSATGSAAAKARRSISPVLKPVESGTAATAEEHRRRASTRITVFTTRPDTLFGATYLVLAPEHPLVVDERHHRGLASPR